MIKKYGLVTKLILYFFTFSTLLLVAPLQAQNFKASAIFGINASQIDGDTLFGYNKAGLTAGARLSYQNTGKIDVALEMLYSQRGSSVSIFNNERGRKINLNYIELPIIVSIRDWYDIKNKYYKVRADVGMSYGYLFDVSTVGFDDQYFVQNDLSWILGVGLNFSKSLGVSLRYTSSFSTMYKDPGNESKTMKGYFITLRTEYTF